MPLLRLPCLSRTARCTLALLLLTAFLGAPLYAQNRGPEETVRTEVYTPGNEEAFAATEGAVCPGDVPIGAEPLKIQFQVTTTSPTPVQYTATFSFSNGTLDATVTSDTHGNPSPVVDGGTTTYTVQGTLSNTSPFRVNVVTTAIAVGPAATDWVVRRAGAVTQDEHCTFTVLAPSYTLSVTSQPPGVPIAIEVDGEDEETATTPFSRAFPENTAVAFTAPATFEGVPFTQWQNGETSTDPRYETTVTGNAAVTAIYGQPTRADLALQIETILGATAFDPEAKTATLPLNEAVIFNILLTNTGPDEATSVVVTGGADPAFFALQNVMLDPAIGTCSLSTEGGFFSCAGLTLAADATVQVDVTGVGVAETEATGFSTSTGHPYDPDFGNNDDGVTFTVEEVALVTDLALLKRAREPTTGMEVDPGDTLAVALDGTFVYTLSVANTSTTGGGPNDSPDTVVLDQLPDDVAYVSATTSRGTCRYDEATRLVTCELGTVAAGEQLLDVIAITVRATGDAGTVVRNTASVVGGLPDPDAANDESTVLATPVDVDLAITKEASTQTPGLGVVYFYAITVTNNGPSDAPNTVVRDTLNTRLGFVSATASQGTCSFSATDRVLTCELGTVRSGETVSIRVAVRSDRTTSGVTNRATVTSALPETDRTNNADDELVLIQPLGDGTEITKELSSDRAVVGDTLVYTLRIDLNEDKHVVITDTLAEKVAFVDAVLDRFADCQLTREDRIIRITCRGDPFDRPGIAFTIRTVAVQSGVCPNVATVEEFAVTDADTTLLTMNTDTATVAISQSTPAEAEPDVPRAFRLHANYPNPFNPTTAIRFDVPMRARVRLTVFDVLGRTVATLVDRELTPGRHQAVFEAGDLPSGVYLYRLEDGAFRETRAMLLVK